MKTKAPLSTPPEIEPYRTIDEKAVTLVTGLALGTIRNKRGDGTGPPFYRVGRRCVYRLTEVLGWMEVRKVDKTG